jgi:hypothetical protein
MSAFRRLVGDLLLSARSHDRGMARSALYLVPVALISLYLYRDLYSGTNPPTGTAHPVQSIDVALNAEFCGEPGRYSTRYSVQTFLTTRPDLMSRPFQRAITAHAGSIHGYCQSVTTPVVVSENSLMWLARLALWVNRGLTPDGLGWFLGAVRVLMLLVFGLALLRTGSSVLFSLAAVMVGFAILRAVGVRDSLYPFVLTLPLLHIALHGLAGASEVVRRRPGLWAFALCMGLLTGFSASMRTILLPMCAAMFGVFLLAVWAAGNRPSWRSATTATLAVAALVFTAGYVAYDRVFVAPLRFSGDPNVSNYEYHTFAHPLVLGVSVPENDLSRREGIQWNDMVGFALARRTIPNVVYLGPEYETALLRYYKGLWRDHPREMAQIYFQKLRASGTEVFLSAGVVGAQFALPAAPAQWLDRVTNGLVLFGLAIVVFGAALAVHLRGGGNRMLILALLALCALASLVEAFLTYSIFVAIYYSVLLFFVWFVPLTILQAGADWVARTVFGATDASANPSRSGYQPTTA